MTGSRRSMVAMTAAVVLVVGFVGAASASADRAWRAPVTLATPSDFSSYPQVAMNQAGDTAVVWEQTDGSDRFVQAATRSAGASGFSGAVTLSASGTGDASWPQVAVDPAGGTTAVWTQQEGTNWVVQAATRPAGASDFGKAVDLSGDGNVLYPRVVVDEAGDTTVVWFHSTDSSNWTVQVATRPAGASDFGTPVDLTGTDESGYDPQVATDPAGDTTVVWQSIGKDGDFVQASTRPAGASDFGKPVNLSSGANVIDPEVAVGSAGDTTVAWRQVVNHQWVVSTATRLAGAEHFSDPEFLTQPNPKPSGIRVAVDRAGAATVVVSTYDGSGNTASVEMTRPAGTTGFGPPQVLPDGFLDSFSVTPGGDTVAVLERGDGNQDAVLTATRPAGAADFSEPVPLSPVGQDSFNANLAVDRFGNATVVWSGRTVVQAATFEPVAPQIPVGLTTTTPARPAVPAGPPSTAPAPLPIRRPALTGPSLSHVSVRRHLTHGAVLARTVSLTLSSPATVRAVVQRKATRCRTRAHRWITLGTAYHRVLPAGRASFVFAGKLGRTTLAPGSYRIALSATDRGGRRSSVSTIGFRIR